MLLIDELLFHKIRGIIIKWLSYFLFEILKYRVLCRTKEVQKCATFMLTLQGWHNSQDQLVFRQLYVWLAGCCDMLQLMNRWKRPASSHTQPRCTWSTSDGSKREVRQTAINSLPVSVIIFLLPFLKTIFKILLSEDDSDKNFNWERLTWIELRTF
jgi:hypothetical protein